MAIIERDHIMIMDRIRNMIFDVIDEVWDAVRIAAIQEPLKEKQEEIETLKWNFPLKFKDAKTEMEKVALREEITKKNREIINLKMHQDKTELSFLYIKQGVQVVFNNIMLGYGIVTPKTPSFTLKGDGNIIMQADQSKTIYVTGKNEVGSPTPAVTEKTETAEFVVKVGTKISKRGKEIADFVKECAALDAKRKEIKQEKKLKEQEAAEEAKRIAQEEADRKAKEAEVAAKEESDRKEAERKAQEGEENGY